MAWIRDYLSRLGLAYSATELDTEIGEESTGQSELHLNLCNIAFLGGVELTGVSQYVRYSFSTTMLVNIHQLRVSTNLYKNIVDSHYITGDGHGKICNLQSYQ
jgi:hypothetical protein